MIDWGAAGPIVASAFGLFGTVIATWSKRRSDHVEAQVKVHAEEVSRTERALVDYLLLAEQHFRDCETQLRDIRTELDSEKSLRPKLFSALNAREAEIAKSDEAAALRQSLLDLLERRVPPAE